MSGYTSHREQFDGVKDITQRIGSLELALVEAFDEHITIKEVRFINFGSMTAEELAEAFYNYPIIVKAILASVNVAGRAIKRDLEVSIDTYANKISKKHAGILAGYIKPILPNELSIPAICELDRWFYVDKELRKTKGNWEVAILNKLNDFSKVRFKKRKFTCDEEKFELDAATPIAGDDIQVGIDIKRIEAKQDIHKRSDEIVNKAAKFKKKFPEGKFYAVVYYPFTTDHGNLRTRLSSINIDGIYFASERDSDIEQQSKFVLGASNLLSDQQEGED